MPDPPLETLMASLRAAFRAGHEVAIDDPSPVQREALSRVVEELTRESWRFDTHAEPGRYRVLGRRGEGGGTLAAMARRRPPHREQLTLDASDHDAGSVVAGDGRRWPDVLAALAELEPAGWRIVVATRQAAGVRYTLRREQP